MKSKVFLFSILAVTSIIYSCSKYDSPTTPTQTPIAPTITGFIIPAKLVGDAPFDLTPPTSNSSGAFAYLSSNTTVATISGNTLTIVGAGTTNIKASQAANGNFLAGDISADLVVTAQTTNIVGKLYVSTTGNDSNSGSKNAPFLTINKAAQVAVAGDVVVVKPGTYRPTLKIAPLNSGTADKPIIYQAEVKGEVIIDGSESADGTKEDRRGLITIDGFSASTPRSWIVIDGFTIINAKWAGVIAINSSNIIIKNCNTKNTGASGIIGANSSNVTIINNKVEQACSIVEKAQNTNECITIASVAGFEIAYNTVSDRMVDLNNGGEGIDVKNASSNGTVHHNIVTNLIRVGIYIDAFEKDLDNIDVYANKVYNTTSGITIASEEGGVISNVKVHDNLVYDIQAVGIRLAGYLDNGPLKNISVYQNTVVRCGLGKTPANWENCAFMIEADNTSNLNIIARNNIFAESTNQIRWKNQSYATMDNNLVFGNSTTAGTNAIITDPEFVNSAGADFKLKVSSPAINKALGTPMSAIDFNDFTRDATPDIGAFEYH
jgi:hypothetical protein